MTVRVVRMMLAGLVSLVVGYLALIAVHPAARMALPGPLQWFGRPGSLSTISLAVAAITVLAAMLLRAYGFRQAGAPVAVVVGLVVISLALGLSSYWNCHDDSNPRFFTAVMWTADLVKGSIGDQSLAAGTCPSPTPVALQIARLTAMAALFLSVVGVAVSLFRAGVDRLRVRSARTVTAVVDVDDDAQSMVDAIADTLSRGSTLALITASPTSQCEQVARDHGARVVNVDFRKPETFTELPLWAKLEKLYLLGPDPAANLARLELITKRLAGVRSKQRIPLIVRIDDPWQATAWRAQHFGGGQTQWAADAVGRYEVTASRLLNWIEFEPGIERVLVCGGSQLTLALCANLAQRQLERDYYTAPGQSPLPRMTLVTENAADFKLDHEFARAQLGLPADRPDIETVAERPTLSLLISLLGDVDAAPAAVILVDWPGGESPETSLGTRLAARLPTLPIFAWDPKAELGDQRPVLVGRLRTYRLSMDVPQGQAHDAWERAARLIHDRYAAEAPRRTAATLPWAELDEFYRGSNRRQVRNTLWMAEKIGGHTWNTFGAGPDAGTGTGLHGRPPLEQLGLMGFDEKTALAMARAEHEDWCRYYRDSGWKYGPDRDDARKIHDKLVAWSDIEADPERLRAALTSLATTLSRLRQLGYRSRPIGKTSQWKSFRRRGTVIAEQRPQPWTWTTDSGHTMHAKAGDWAVQDPDGDASWSVRDDIFRSRYRNVGGSLWRGYGTVLARPARSGETLVTLEGTISVEAGDWVVRGEAGEQWAVPAAEFARRYEGPVSD